MRRSWIESESVPAVLTGLSGATSLALSILFTGQLPVPRVTARLVGFVVLYAGAAVVLWAAFHLRSGISGVVAPRGGQLVVSGPYRLVRHPVYLGLTIALLGVSIVARSIAGLVATVVFFLPVEVHRARREERALADRFGDAWRDYTSRTGFFLPRLRKHA